MNLDGLIRCLVRYSPFFTEILDPEGKNDEDVSNKWVSVVNVVVVKGWVAWKVQPATDDSGEPILIARCEKFQSVLWGYTNKELATCMSDAVDLFLAHFINHGREESLRQMGFRVESYPLDPARIQDTEPPIRAVNGTTNFLQPVPVHA